MLFYEVKHATHFESYIFFLFKNNVQKQYQSYINFIFDIYFRLFSLGFAFFFSSYYFYLKNNTPIIYVDFSLFSLLIIYHQA